ncbi:ABC transporter ATP-binding protein [Pigmentiphaga soli]|uniref:ABC transporter ATP-binding protein n=1 Tax=Pigmentiphaga soli TaxID=1007095 RepID=A0ABP8GPB1_9BURK
MSLVVRKLSKRYGVVKALDDVDMVIEKGSFTTLLGPSGSGKSTLLMCMAGFIEPTSGEIELNGRSLVGVLPEKRGLGVVFQGYALFPTMTVARNIAFPLRMRGWSAADIDRAVRRMLQLVQLESFAGRKPAELSGGQQQRVALARALSFNPEIVLLDEPLSALDRALRESLRAELKEIHRSTGTTFVMVTHDQEEALSLSQKIVVLNGGRVEQQGDPVDIYLRPRTLFASRFVGMANLFEVTVSAVEDGVAVCALPDGGRLFAPVDPGRPFCAGDKAVLCVRPESVEAGESPAAPGAAVNVQRGRLVSDCFEGFDRILEVDTAAGLQKVRLRAAGAQRRFDVGQPLTLSWPASAGHLIAAQAA